MMTYLRKVYDIHSEEMVSEIILKRNEMILIEMMEMDVLQND